MQAVGIRQNPAQAVGQGEWWLKGRTGTTPQTAGQCEVGVLELEQEADQHEVRQPSGVTTSSTSASRMVSSARSRRSSRSQAVESSRLTSVVMRIVTWNIRSRLRSFVGIGERHSFDALPLANVLVRFRDGPAREEVLAYALGLIAGQHPSGVLRLGRSREVLAKVRPNELAADAQFVRERLGPDEFGIRHLSLPSFVRLLAKHSASNVRTQGVRERIYNILTIACKCQPPPATSRRRNPRICSVVLERSEQDPHFSAAKEAA